MSILTHLKCAARDWGKQFDRKVLILMYHRVAEVDADPWGLCVSPQHFREQLEVLGRSCRILRLSKLTETLERGKVPRRCVIVTFDDGYGDNLTNAKPILEKYDTPATFFLVSGQIGRQKEFWWDELERIFLQTEILPDELKLEINAGIHRWTLGESRQFSSEDGKRHSKWRTEMEAPTSRHSTYYAVWQLMQPMEEAWKQEILEELCAWAGIEREVRPTYRTLSGEEVCTLAEGELVEIGAHTVSHPVLSRFSSDVQRQEVEQCKFQLEAIANRSVKTFAYPHGDYSDVTMSVLQDSGFRCACSTAPEILRNKLDLFRLPRFQAPDCDGEQFSKHLLEWFEEK